MKKFDILYSRDSKGNIVQWQGYVEGTEFSNDYAKIIILEGLLTGVKTKYERNIKKGKNIGKINETTPYEQAISELKSRYEKKKKQGYKSTQDIGIGELSGNDSPDILELYLPKLRTDSNNLLKPVKCQPYYKENGDIRIKFPCFIQPKLNGFRVFCRWEEVEEGEGLFKTKVEKPVFRSKEGLKYIIFEHIEKELTKDLFFNPFKKDYSTILDGEMYIHGEILSEISSAVRKRNPKTLSLTFNVFDLAIENVPQTERINMLNTISPLLSLKRIKNTKIVETKIVNTDSEVQKKTNDYIERGYEGSICRDIRAIYQFGKRPQTMVKLKRTQDKEFTIIDITDSEGAPELAIFVCKNEEGLPFKVVPDDNHETRKEYFLNKQNYIGKQVTIKFHERTKDNIPFHIKEVTLRDYEQ